jgi:hypothetical protein
MTSAFEKIPPTPLCQRGARGDFAWVSAKLNSIGVNGFAPDL